MRVEKFAELHCNKISKQNGRIRKNEIIKERKMRKYERKMRKSKVIMRNEIAMNGRKL